MNVYLADNIRNDDDDDDDSLVDLIAHTYKSTHDIAKSGKQAGWQAGKLTGMIKSNNTQRTCFIEMFIQWVSSFIVVK